MAAPERSIEPVVRAVDLLEHDAELRQRWQRRFSHLFVDEFQDVDAAQLRLVRILAEPQQNLFVVGDDDQTIYAWRLANVRRILGFSELYPDAQRVQVRVPEDLTRLIAVKGSVTLDGVSLTVNAVRGTSVEVMLIPHTLSVTTLGGLRPARELNLEVDLLARYVERCLAARA